MIGLSCKWIIFNISREGVTIEFFRESFKDSSGSIILPSLPRQVFGRHPTNGKILAKEREKSLAIEEDQNPNPPTSATPALNKYDASINWIHRTLY